MQMAKLMITTFCMKIKFSIRIGVGFIKFDQCLARQCHMLFVKQTREREKCESLQ